MSEIKILLSIVEPKVTMEKTPCVEVKADSERIKTMVQGMHGDTAIANISTMVGPDLVVAVGTLLKNISHKRPDILKEQLGITYPELEN